jgi:hypothetical protein
MGEGLHMSAKNRQAVSDHMQKNLPAQLKQYAGAYMEQQVLSPGSSVSPSVSPSYSSRAPAPQPDRRRLDHSSDVSAAQYEARFNSNLFAPDSQPQPTVPPPPAEIPPTGPADPDYGFIMQPPKPPRRGLNLPGLSGNSSPIMRIAIVLGILLVVVIIFVVIKGLFSGGGNKQALTTVAQEQQAMIHILTNGPGQDSQQQAPLSDASNNFSATAQASLTSAQQQLLDYMTINHMKVGEKQLVLKTNPAIDQQLTDAASNSTYESTFKQVMRDQLLDYEQALQTAYKQTTGPKGRALLSQDFDGAQLLLKELDSTD